MARNNRDPELAPAFPCPGWIDHRHGDLIDGNEQYDGHPGMNYRQWLIGQVAMGLAARPNYPLDNVAPDAAEIADQIIDRLTPRKS